MLTFRLSTEPAADRAAQAFTGAALGRRRRNRRAAALTPRPSLEVPGLTERIERVRQPRTKPDVNNIGIHRHETF
ncbi:MAG: hypothetical protein M1457_14400 [bacterium]|nr:hypothetical protein [bacterium]